METSEEEEEEEQGLRTLRDRTRSHQVYPSYANPNIGGHLRERYREVRARCLMLLTAMIN